MRIAALYMPLVSIVLENKERFRPLVEPTNPDAALGNNSSAEGEFGSTVGSSGRPPSTAFDAASVASQRTMIINSGSSTVPLSVGLGLVLCNVQLDNNCKFIEYVRVQYCTLHFVPNVVFDYS